VSRCRALALAVLLATSNACSLMTGGVKVEPVAVATQKPGNVALYVAVSQHGSGVLGLQKDDFKVYENGVALDNDQIGLTLLPTTESATRHAAILVDMSKSLKPSERKSLSDALHPFIVRLRQREAVSLYAYDGAEKVHLVQEYARDARAEPDEKDTSMDRLLSFSRRDASTSLYSAVIDGAKHLDASLAAEGRPIQNGTVIVIALNPDSAGRVDEGKLRDFIDDSPHQYFLMTVGTTASAANIAFIGKNGETRAGSAMTMSAPLNDVANAVDDAYFRSYLVSYCSPARAGTRDLKLEVTTRDAQGKTNKGSYSTQFDAAGFGPGCSSQMVPRFVIATKEKEPEKPRKALAQNAKAPMKAPATAYNPEKVSSSAPAPKASAAPIAEPPIGLGYE
jgi:hypothetical protein